ncbi:DUF192 domain-containing protein [Comamonas sp.]|uniref:DUF192 domain-containing protein n=1 Tax=Comamonas sp. TaxID=34028 RepID=UPI0028A65BF5|nr:DUF192 domain-containing protein [Comamonas sp.]
MPALKAQVAERFSERAFGLIFRPPPGSGEALVFERCAAVHTCFMRYAIDVGFVDAQQRVLRISTGLAPWRMAWCRGAQGVLELRSGEAARLGLAPGQRLQLC